MPEIKMVKSRYWLTFGVVVGFICIPSAIKANLVSEALVTITATNDRGSATFDVPLDAGVVEGETTTWSLQEPVVLVEEGGSSTVLETLTVEFNTNPFVIMNFAVLAGNFGGTFNLNSVVVNFPAITPAFGHASAALTLTDGSDPADGASITPTSGATEVFSAIYNGTSTFATLLGGFSAAPGSSASANDEFPVGGGFSTTTESGAAIGPVTSIQSAFSFQLSANDRVAGNSRFDIDAVPEPSAFLFGLVVTTATAVTHSLRRRR